MLIYTGRVAGYTRRTFNKYENLNEDRCLFASQIDRSSVWMYEYISGIHLHVKVQIIAQWVRDWSA